MTNPTTTTFSEKVERLLIEQLIDAILAADPGNVITVNDGEEDVLIDSRDKKAILEAMFSTDEDYLYIGNSAKLVPNNPWLLLIHGNGSDVISDYSQSLHPIIEPILNLSNQIDDGGYNIVPHPVAVKAEA